MAIKPVLHRIIIKPDSIEDRDEAFKRAKQAGIFIDSNEREREQAAVDSGTVISIGSTAFKDFGADNPVSVGDRVVYARYAGKAIVDPADEIKYVAINDEDLIAILITEKGA